MNGIFITLEGPDGSGKTTVGARLAERLEAAGIQFVKTREPGGSKISDVVREIFLNDLDSRMDAKTEALLIAGARRQHVVELIRPALAEGKLVLCDRFIDSSLAYQGVGRDIGIDEVLKINQFAVETTMPDVTYYLDVPADVGLARIAANKGREVNRLDMEDVTFHNKVQTGYETVRDMFPERIEIIDATRTIDEIVTDIFERIQARLG